MKISITLEMHRFSVRVMHDDVVRDVRVERDFVVLCRRVNVYTSRAAYDVIIGERHESRVLHEYVDYTVERVVENLPAAVDYVIGRKRHAHVVLADVLEDKSAADVVRHPVVGDHLCASRSYKYNKNDLKT